MPVTALIDLQYLPPISYFTALSKFDEVRIEACENFIKQTYRNRCYINTSQGPLALVVPLTGSGKHSIREIAIDNNQKWRNIHWRAIQSAYGKAPFFEYYADDLHDNIFKPFDRLYDLNFCLLTMCLKWLKWSIPVSESKQFEKTLETPIIDLRSAITPKKITGGGRFYEPAVYHQVFGNKFVENLSLIDLVFCEGPVAWTVVQASTPK